ncbi:MAG: hypothetical protein A3F68_05470 [Acidobacteria bacterium RIFCSPLOWO2_12_FULL_54_10]|nr:MAG: hypothetical protein A3F68_05470 [Acidobacteria bacterium RIFCSPLOWO2_12_FULL_54_10]
MPDILDKLRGGDRRQIGRAEEVAREIADDPKLFSKVFVGMLDDDALVRMRAADAVEKATREYPQLLQPYKRKLLLQISNVNQQEVRWHVAQILPRLRLTANKRDCAVSILLEYLNDKSSIVKTFSMQALADFAEQSPRLQRQVVPILEGLTQTGSPAMRSRGRKLLAKLQKQGGDT